LLRLVDASLPPEKSSARAGEIAVITFFFAKSARRRKHMATCIGQARGGPSGLFHFHAYPVTRLSSRCAGVLRIGVSVQISTHSLSHSAARIAIDEIGESRRHLPVPSLDHSASQ
jgi:hypothetical protein